MTPHRTRSGHGLSCFRAAIAAAVLLTLTAAPAPAQPDSIEALAWMAGCWRSPGEGPTTEECWLAPGGGILLGVNRGVSSRGTSFEFLRIADDGGGLTYFASPGGRSVTPFRLVELGEERAVFSNPEHDFPQRVLYWREGERMHARVDGTVGGETQALDFVWERVAPSAGPATW